MERSISTLKYQAVVSVEEKLQKKAKHPSLYDYYTTVGGDSPMMLSRTEANLWDASNPGRRLRLSGDENYLDHLRSIGSRKSEGQNQCFVFTTTGDATAEWCPLMLSKEALHQTVDFLGDRETMLEILQSRFPYICSHILYSDRDKPEALFIGFRCPTSTEFLIGGIRIELQSLNAIAMLSFPGETETESFHQMLRKNLQILRSHPLSLIVLIFRERYSGWSRWFAQQWKVVSEEVEVATGMTSKRWLAMRAPGRPLTNTKALLERVHEVQAELSHIETVMRFESKRIGEVALEAVEQVEAARKELDLPASLNRKDRAELIRRMKHVASRCVAVNNRLPELKNRLKVQIDVVNGLITQEDSRNRATIAERQTFISERAAEDSRVMRIIGLLTALFLPATFVTTLWSTSLVNLEAPISWLAWLGASVALTAIVTGFLWLYDRQTAGKRGLKRNSGRIDALKTQCQGGPTRTV